ncbi:MAG: hypothetical protein K1X66_08110 [Verrucomicrobiae bacterium]|nr:hypothetical protein [Verrucomicrobiae bacterium]
MTPAARLLARVIAERAAGRVLIAKDFARDARAALETFKKGQETLDAARLLSRDPANLRLQSQNFDKLVQFSTNAESGILEGGEAFGALLEAMQAGHGEFSLFLDKVSKISGIPDEVYEIIKKELATFEAVADVIHKYQNGAMRGVDSYEGVMQAIKNKKIDDLPKLLEQAVKDCDDIIRATEHAVAALEIANALFEQQAARIVAIVGGTGATLVALKPEEVQAAEDLIDDLEFRLKVDCEVEKKARRKEPSFGQKVWASLKEGPDTGMMGLSPDVLDWSGAGAMTELGVVGVQYANMPNQPKCDDPIPQASTRAEIARMRANVEAAWKVLEAQQDAAKQTPNVATPNSPVASDPVPKISP